VLRWIAVTSTAYCLGGTMADGTGVRWGSVASNQYPLGTVMEVTPAPTGRRRWIVRDRIGWGTQLDFWAPTCALRFAVGTADRSHPALAPPPPPAGDRPVPGRPWPQAFIGTRGPLL
jgi:hypothetical protein